MKTNYRNSALVASALVLGLIAAQSANAAPDPGIRGTFHNLSPYWDDAGTTPNSNVIHTIHGNNSLNDELCIFCHTPHGASKRVEAPLWNKNLQNTNYTVYVSGTMQGNTDDLNNGNKHMSLACLSCHDGTQAMDNVINAPGSENYDNSGGGASGRDVSWSVSGSTGEVSTDGKMQGNESNAGAMGISWSTSLNLAGTPAMLSPDLTNDHPIAMAYCGGGMDTDGTTGTCADTYFNAASSTVDAMASTVWYVAGAGGATSQVTIGQAGASGLRLYGTNPATATVECGSCHDPHTTTATFLRLTGGNNNSQVCLSCHDK